MSDEVMEFAPDTFDVRQLFQLETGDIIEVPGLMPGLDDETVVGMVIGNTPQYVRLRLTYHGVWIGTYQLEKGSLKWNKA